jgi:hypothetical protein
MQTISVFRHYLRVREPAYVQDGGYVEEKAWTLEVSLLQYAGVLTLAGPDQDPIDLPSMCASSRGLGPCGCEFASLLLAWLSCLRARTGIMLASGVTGNKSRRPWA